VVHVCDIQTLLISVVFVLAVSLYMKICRCVFQGCFT